MSTRHVGVILSVLAVTILTAACSAQSERVDFVHASSALHSNMRVAVLPFENLTDHPNAGIIAAQLFSSELYRRRLFRQTEESDVRRRLVQRDIDVERLQDSTFAQAAAQGLGVDAVLVGSVSDYGYQRGLREDPSVGLNIRLVASRNGEVLWAASYSSTGGGAFARESANQLAQELIARMVDALARRMGET